MARFRRLGLLADLENAISVLKHAADLTHDGHRTRQGTCRTWE